MNASAEMRAWLDREPERIAALRSEVVLALDVLEREAECRSLVSPEAALLSCRAACDVLAGALWKGHPHREAHQPSELCAGQPRKRAGGSSKPSDLELLARKALGMAKLRTGDALSVAETSAVLGVVYNNVTKLVSAGVLDRSDESGFHSTAIEARSVVLKLRAMGRTLPCDALPRSES